MSKNINKKANTNQQLTVKSAKSTLFSKNLLLAAIIVITGIVFSNSINNDFINWDDEVYVTVNNYIKDFSPSGIAKIFSSYTKDELPITLFSLAIDYKLWGLNPMPFHAMNVLFHLINVFLVFYFISLLTKRNEAALIGALLFAIHPFRVESVTWVAERKDVLFTLFYLCSLISYINYIKKNKKLFLLITLILSVFSLLSKFMAVSLPLVLFAIDYYYGRKISWKTILEKVPFFIMPIISGIIHYKSATGIELVGEIIQKYSIIDTIFIAFYALSFYLFKFVVPFNLSALHPYPDKLTGMLPMEYYIAPALILVAIYIFYRLRRNTFIKKEVTFGMIFFIATIALVLQIVPFGGKVVVAERYTYLPYIGLCFIAGQMYCMVLDNKFRNAYRFKNYILVAVLSISLIFSIITFNRNEVYKDNYTFWEDVIDKYPDFYFAHFSYGIAKMYKKDYDEAMKQYDKAIELNPDFAIVYNNRGLAKQDLKDFDGAIKDFEKAISLKPNYDVAYYNLGLVKSNVNDHKAAIENYNKAIKLNPEYFSAYYNRGNAKCMIHDYSSAIKDYTKAIEIDGANATYYCNRGLAKISLKQYPSAIEDLNKAIVIDPNLDKAYNNRGLAKYDTKDYNGAIADFTKTIELNPNYASAYLNRGLSRLMIQDINGACNDWMTLNKAGIPDADNYIKQYCNK